MKILFFLIFLLLLSSESKAICNGVMSNRIDAQYVHKIEMKQYGYLKSPCSATLIKKRTILTAAHCIDKLNLNNEISVRLNGTELEVEKIFVPIGYYDAYSRYIYSQNLEEKTHFHRETAFYDIAIINLKKPIPSKLKRAYLQLDGETANGANVKAVGFGYTHYNLQTSFFYNSPTVPFERSASLNKLSNNVYILYGRGLKDFLTSPGDSGGPLFISGTNIQIGVLRGSSATKKTSASIYAPLYKHRHFIEKFAK